MILKEKLGGLAGEELGVSPLTRFEMPQTMRRHFNKLHKLDHSLLPYARRWKIPIILAVTTVVGVIVATTLENKATATTSSSQLIFAISMLALIPSGSLLRQCIRHLINWTQVRLEDPYKAHMIAGVFDCLLG